MQDNIAKSATEAHRKWREKNPEQYQQYQKEYYLRNAEKKRAAAKAWRENNPERAKENGRRQRNSRAAKNARLKYKFGITLEEYEGRLMAQGGVCAICKQPPGTMNLHVDHCHKTEKVRGLLCGNCNRSIGLMKDRPEVLRKAAEYLEASRDP